MGKRLKKVIMLFLVAVLVSSSAVTTVSAQEVRGTYSTVDMFANRSTIKGMQGASYETVGNYGGLEHTLQNVRINECIYPTDHYFFTQGMVPYYEFEGENFAIMLPNYLMQWIKRSNECNMTTSVVFLLAWDDERTFLINENARQAGYPYYAPATSGYGEKAIRALFANILEECEKQDCHIDNFILGNEVNMPDSWHYSGTTDPYTCATMYADSFYDMYSVVRQYTDVSRCSISIDHSWTHNNMGHGVGARDYLHHFNNRLAEYGDIDWFVSMHLYPAILYETDIWAGDAHILPQDLNPKSVDASFIDGNNLSYMTNYIKENFGEEHRVMLTEQGFTDYMGEEYQAAALAYSYYAALYDPMVDSFVINVENSGGQLNFNIDGKLAGEVYTKIGNGNAEDAAWIDSTILPIIGVNSWSEIVPNYGDTSFRTKDGICIEEGRHVLYSNNAINYSYTGWYPYEGELYWLTNGIEFEVEYGQPGDANYTGWYRNEDVIQWLEAGVAVQNKRVYDSASDGWYWFDENGNMVTSREVYADGAWRWLDADGKMARSKDVFQTSSGGKWVRYNEDGEMIKGEDYRNDAWYYFEPITGTMVKGPVILEDGRKVFYDTVTGQMLFGEHTINGNTFVFDSANGNLVSGPEGLFWVNADGKDFWYENWQRQGWEPANDAYRGKEIFDPASNAWYWLDNVQHGAKAVSKDVYQESLAGAWGDYTGEDGQIYGKWVRYDANGYMIKGWSEDGKYYFDPIYGSMAKGEAVIDGVTYYFDVNTGVKQ